MPTSHNFFSTIQQNNELKHNGNLRKQQSSSFSPSLSAQDAFRLSTESTVQHVNTPAGGHVVLDLTFPVNTEAGVAVGAGDRHPGVETVAVVRAFGF